MSLRPVLEVYPLFVLLVCETIQEDSENLANDDMTTGEARRTEDERDDFEPDPTHELPSLPSALAANGSLTPFLRDRYSLWVVDGGSWEVLQKCPLGAEERNVCLARALVRARTLRATAR
jgi:hypothetical protein